MCRNIMVENPDVIVLNVSKFKIQIHNEDKFFSYYMNGQTYVS